jgi:hypothetical protein
MRCSRFALLTVLVSFCLGLAAFANSAGDQPPTVDNDFIQKQFGSTCSLVGALPVVADMDGDGVDDLVVPARCTNPMMDQAENNFRVVDPYFSFFGYGNPKITTAFSAEVPERRGIVLLIIHGAGPEAWRSPTPKAKFLIVNLPFKTIAVKRMALRKRQVMGIYVEETGGDEEVSVVYWDGKKYRYQPMGSSLE